MTSPTPDARSDAHSDHRGDLARKPFREWTTADADAAIARGVAIARENAARLHAAGAAPLRDTLRGLVTGPRAETGRASEDGRAAPADLPAKRDTVCGCGAAFTQLLVTEASVLPHYVPLRCPTCSEAFALALRQEADDTARADRAERRRRLLSKLGVPPEYQDATLDTFALHGDAGERARQAAMRARMGALEAAVLANPDVAAPCTVLYGPSGTGKSLLGWAVTLRAAFAGRRVEAGKWRRLRRYLTGTWHGGDGDPEPERRRVLRLQRAELLFIDELSTHAMDDGGRRAHGALLEIIGERIEWRRPTIVTTNDGAVDGHGVVDVFGAPLFSRIAGVDGFVRSGDRDFRVEELFARAREQRGG